MLNCISYALYGSENDGFVDYRYRTINSALRSCDFRFLSVNWAHLNVPFKSPVSNGVRGTSVRWVTQISFCAQERNPAEHYIAICQQLQSRQLRLYLISGMKYRPMANNP